MEIYALEKQKDNQKRSTTNVKTTETPQPCKFPLFLIVLIIRMYNFRLI